MFFEGGGVGHVCAVCEEVMGFGVEEMGISWFKGRRGAWGFIRLIIVSCRSAGWVDCGVDCLHIWLTRQRVRFSNLILWGQAHMFSASSLIGEIHLHFLEFILFMYARSDSRRSNADRLFMWRPSSVAVLQVLTPRKHFERCSRIP